MRDFVVTNHGSLFSFRPITPAAREWVDENVPLESWQWLGRSFHVDHRFAAPLIEGIAEAGLSINN